MDNEIDYGKELDKARKQAALHGRQGSQAALEAHWEVCCGDVLVAEKNLRDQDRVWENASLAREFLDMAGFLEGYDDMLDNLYEAIQRMRCAIMDHPRLRIRILELERTVIRRIEALHDHDLNAAGEVEEELAYYRRNTEYADSGRYDRIVQRGHLKKDPVEWSPDYESIIDEADRKIYSLLEGHPRGMGFCFAYWSTKRRVLKECYGINWNSPAMMNPGVMFD